MAFDLTPGDIIDVAIVVDFHGATAVATARVERVLDSETLLVSVINTVGTPLPTLNYRGPVSTANVVRVMARAEEVAAFAHKYGLVTIG